MGGGEPVSEACFLGGVLGWRKSPFFIIELFKIVYIRARNFLKLIESHW
jgi:hypothetical protein